ncbi:hypothetical protein HK102_007681, partial [Quaeritorhiza haematococci]
MAKNSNPPARGVFYQDLLWPIFQNLPQSDLRNCSLVNRSWHGPAQVLLYRAPYLYSRDSVGNNGGTSSTSSRPTSPASSSTPTFEDGTLYVKVDGTHTHEECGDATQRTLELFLDIPSPTSPARYTYTRKLDLGGFKLVNPHKTLPARSSIIPKPSREASSAGGGAFSPGCDGCLNPEYVSFETFNALVELFPLLAPRLEYLRICSVD